MKRFLIVFTSLLLAMGALSAQDLKTTLKKAEKVARNASRAVDQFAQDNSKKELLQEAIDQARSATNMVEDISAEELENAFDKDRHVRQAKRDLADIWESAGKAYLQIANQITTAQQLGLDMSAIPEVDYPALKASDALKKALTYTDRNFQKKAIADQMTNAQGALNNMGTIAFEQSKDYPRAYLNFNQVLELHQMLQEQGGTSMLESEAMLQDQMYFAGLSALNAQMIPQAQELFQELYEMKYDNPLVYEAMYKVNKEGDVEEAYAYLKAGREKYPDDTGLLFTEINHFLQMNALDELISKLESAIEKEPKNVSLYTTMGNVYDQLYQREAKEENKAQSEEYFDLALQYFEKALEIDPEYFDATYSIGTLYYNKAAILVGELQELEDDYSKEGLKKYEAQKEEIFAQFDDALPYFKRCEKLNPNDVNTLIALREIYARKDMLDMVEVFKERLEQVQNGEQYEESYFQQR